MMKQTGTTEEEEEDMRFWMQDKMDLFFYGLVVVSMALQIVIRLTRKKSEGEGPYTAGEIARRATGKL